MNYRIIYLDLPPHIKGYTLLRDDFYTIVLNSSLNRETNAETLLHELKHIQNGDFDKKCSASILEVFAHDD